MKPMAAPAIDAIESGHVTYHPPVHNKVALDWLKAIRPGTCHGSSGGGTSCRSGTAPTAT